MTHSEHIGKGLFIKSAELTYQLCINQNVYGVLDSHLNHRILDLKKIRLEFS